MEENIEKERMLAIGTTLSNGKYRIEKYISSGGFGNTYLAIDTAFDEKVAIKELFIKGVCGRQDNSSEISVSLTENKRTFAAQREKFRKEARRLRKLTNKHIVHVHDLFDDNGTSYYVMDFIEGESLSDRLKRTNKPLTESEMMLILPQILDALETVHKEQIWHLDLKPANIMIDKDGNVQLIDFGASKQLRSADGNSLSTSSAMSYTPGYASSEQMEQNYEKFGPWTDLYSLGATIYNLLTKNMPPSPSDIAENAEEALPLPKEVSRKTHDLIMWMMRPVRTMRPQSVADVKQFLNEEPSAPKNVGQDTHAKDNNATTGNDDTVMKGGNVGKKAEQPKVSETSGNKTQPKPIAKPKTNNGGRSNKGKGYTIDSSILYAKKRKGIVVGGVIATALVMCAGIGYGTGMFGTDNKNDSTIVDDKTVMKSNVNVITSYNVTDSMITVDGDSIPANMRKYTYTGVVDASTKLPSGKGIAKFDKHGNIAACTYKGNFVDGICDDDEDATLVFDNGDKYTGSFKMGYYNEGTYSSADGSYFTGTFKDGNTYNGSWYTKDGTPDGKVVNGK